MDLSFIAFGGGSGLAPVSTQIIWLIFKLIFWLCLLIGLAIWTYKMYQYKYWVLFLEKSGKDVSVILDEAKVVKDLKNKGYDLYLKRHKRKYPLIDFKFKKLCKGGGLKGFFKKGMFFNYKYGEYSATPVDFKFKNNFLKEFKFAPLEMTELIHEGLDLVPIDSDISQFNQLFNETIDKTEKTSSFQTYLPLIITIGGLGVLVTLSVVMMIMLKDVNTSFQSAASAFTNAATKIAESNVAQNAIEVAPGFGG